MMNLVTAPASETFSVVGTCINCTTPASLMATMIVIAIGVALALRSERRNGVSREAWAKQSINQTRSSGSYSTNFL